MLWFHLSVLSAAAKAANQAITKTLTSNFSVLTVAAYGQLAAGVLILPLIFFPDLVSLPSDPAFHKAAGVTIGINIVAIILIIEAIKKSDLSYALPFLGLTPVFTILTGWLLRGEVINATGIAGIFIVCIGTLCIDTLSIKDWITLGGRRIFKDSGVILVTIVALLYSVSSVYDKTATLLSDPYTFVWYSAEIRAVALMMILYGWSFSSRTKTAGNNLSAHHCLLFTLLGVTFIAEALFQMVAMQTGFVAYVIAIKRLGILMTSLVGIIVYKEEFTWARLAGAVLIVFGASIIYIS